MLPIDALVREAAHLTEAARVLQICNACRYCEGFCAVFPAMARRLEFPAADIHYLANLCHGCSACLHACQYADPHEFQINVPQVMAQVRATTYADYAWPPALAGLVRRQGLVLGLSLAFGLALFLLLAVALHGGLWHAPLAGQFYAVFPHGLLVSLFGPVFAFACIALGLGVARFWRDISPGQAGAAAAGEALKNVLQLKYLDGGHGEGCNDGDDRFTLWRRRFHHCTFYGFGLCFAATAVATLYHSLAGQPAPYALTSPPVLLGMAGGLGLLVGPAGLWWLHFKRYRQTGPAPQQALDRGLIALLFFTSLTGLALLAWRDSSAMALLLCVHLGFVMALFLTLPYGKFGHGFYRAAALLKWAIERRRPAGPFVQD